MDIILGLDVSTVCIGVTLAMENDGKVDIMQVTHFKMKGNGDDIRSMFIKCRDFETVLESYKDLTRFNTDEHITRVVIEEPLVGSNNSLTVSKLLRFNGMISISVYNILNVIPDFISSYDARRYAFPELMSIRKYNKKGEIYPLKKIMGSLKNNKLALFGGYDYDCDKKNILLNKISDLFPTIEWIYNKKGELRKENYDASDSLVCVIGWVRKQLYKDYGDPIVESYTKTDMDNMVLITYVTAFGPIKFQKKIEIPIAESE